MAENTKIEWCHHTFNAWRGCTKVSAGCANCYAETLSHRNPGTLGVWGPNGTRVVAADSAWREPVKWNKAAAKAGERHRVFCASLADVFEDWQGLMTNSNGSTATTSPAVPWMAVARPTDFHGNPVEPDRQPNPDVRPLTMDDVRSRLFALIDATPNLDWLLLTKRPERVLHWLPPHWRTAGFPRNVWLGTSVENQQAADERIPHLLRVPAAVRFLSMEPLLGPVDLRRFLPNLHTGFPRGPRVGWGIVGGESGHGARPMHPRWARSLRDQCQAAGVPFFFKQWGEYATSTMVPADRVLVGKRWEEGMPDGEADEVVMYRVGKKAAGRLLDGREWNELPEVACPSASN
jgi:protein gp37